MAQGVRELKRILNGIFQKIIKNMISLGDDSTLESDTKPLKVGGKTSPLELSETELKVTGTINVEDVNVGDPAVQISNQNISTPASDLTLDPDGDLIISGADVKIDSGKNLYIDGGGDTYIREHGADSVRYFVGGDSLMTMSENGASGNQVLFDACVGFDQKEPTYNATDTNVDFRFTNKQFLTFDGGNIADLNLFFPAISGNFVLLIKQDGTGSRTVAADGWLVFEYDESAADGSSTVKWAGGSNPTLTTDANHVDILSFYWDSDNEIAYGVATLDFQF